MLSWILRQLGETIGESIRISVKESPGCYELKKHKPWLKEGRSILSDQGKQTKLQRLQDAREINGDNPNNARREARNKMREYLKDKIT
jgi:hypothetical protein